MPRILICLEDRELDRRVREWLAEAGRAEALQGEPAPAAPFDLVILDLPTLKRRRSTLHSWKEAAAQLFLPFLLIAAEGDLPPLLLQGGRLVDEIIRAPFTKPLLLLRVQNLLRLRRLSRKIQAGEARFQLFMRYLPGAAVMRDLDGRYLYANDTWERIGVKSREWMGKTLEEVWPPEIARRFKENDRRVIELKQPLQSLEPIPDGEEMCYWLSNRFPILDDTGRVALVGSIGIDITRRWRAEEAVREQARVLDTFFAHTLTPLALLNREFNYIQVNNAFAAAARLDVSEFPGRGHFDLFPAETQDIFAEVVKTREPFQTQAWPLVFPDQPERGKTYWDWTLVPILAETGEVDFLVLSLNEVTAQVVRGHQIIRQTKLLAAINRVFRETLADQSEAEVAQTCLEVAQTLTGSRFGFIGRVNDAGRFDTMALSDPGWNACRIPREEAAAVIRDMAMRGLRRSIIETGQALLSNDPASEPEMTPLPEGHPPLQAFLGVPLTHQGRSLGLIALANKEGGYEQADLEDLETLSVALVEALQRREAVAALRVSEEHFRVLFNTAGSSIALLSPQYQLLEFNQEAERVSGWQRHEVLGKNALDLFVPEPGRDQAERELARVLQGDLVQGIGLPLRVRDGRERQFLFNGSPLYDLEGRLAGIIVVGHDVTDIQQATAALRESEQQLRRLTSQLLSAQEKARRRLARELHDELGQSLLALKMQLREIYRQLPPHPPALKEGCLSARRYLNDIIDNVRRLSRDLSPAILEDLGLVAALRHLLDEFSKVHNIRLGAVELEEARDRLTKETKINIYRIFQEALTNVAKHARASRIAAAIKREGDRMVFSLEDNGVGFRVEEAPTRGAPAKGLGLATMAERVKMLGGSFNLQSQPGLGTKITFTIPLDAGGSPGDTLSHRAG